MGAATDGNQPQPVYEERVVMLARKLLRNASENGLDPNDLEAACSMAQRMLEDSEARTNDPATLDPEHQDVIRRTSSETSSSGETTSRRTYQTD
jgi:hypothetical protein